MPSRSRARNSVSRLRSQSANANMPLKRSTQSSPHSSQRVDDHLGVAARPERWPSAVSSGMSVAEVVDLAVEDDDDAAVLVVERLLAAREVDDRQPAMTEADAGLEMKAVAVRTAMLVREVHALDDTRIDSALAREIDDTDNSAHGGL